MTNYRIFIEGDKNEKKFLEQFILHIQPGIVTNFSIIPVNGWTNLRLIENQFTENTDFGGVNIVIFDADDTTKDPVHGGFTLRKAKLEDTLSALDYNLFLFPNNKDDGDFELLLEHSVNPDHSVVLNCFNNYETCLSSYINPTTTKTLYKIPVRKSKMYAYIDSFYKTEKEYKNMKDGDWLFNKSEIWNLDSDILKELRDFLLSIFSKY